MVVSFVFRYHHHFSLSSPPYISIIAIIVVIVHGNISFNISIFIFVPCFCSSSSFVCPFEFLLCVFLSRVSFLLIVCLSSPWAPRFLFRFLLTLLLLFPFLFFYLFFFCSLSSLHSSDQLSFLPSFLMFHCLFVSFFLAPLLYSPLLFCFFLISSPTPLLIYSSLSFPPFSPLLSHLLFLVFTPSFPPSPFPPCCSPREPTS